ncbi:MAG: hypothetical protein E7593_03980 [Ruminococcaceae bacterium]|nr:hypothetical protein [Oscillospiraceae bacterium]
MKEKIAYFENNGTKYPLVFNLNVMEEIQEKYGSLAEWGRITQGQGEPKIKDLKFGLLAMINEGIEIENENNNEGRPLMSLKQLGRLMANVGVAKIVQTIRDITVASAKTEADGKNE